MSEDSLEEKECLEKYYAGFSLAFFEKGDMPMPVPNEKYNFLLNSKHRHPYSFLTRYVNNIEKVDSTYNFLKPETKNDKESSENLTFDYCFKDYEGKGSIYLVQTLNGVLGYGVEVYDYYQEFKQNMTEYRQLADNTLSREFHRCKNIKNYINSICDYIIQEYDQCKRQDIKSLSKYTPFYRILLNQYRKILLHLIDEYTSYLKRSIYKKLIYLTRHKEDTKSFIKKGIKIQQVQDLRNYFDELKMNGFIHDETHITTLYDLFSGIIMPDKIDWADDIVTLYTFIRLLIDNDKIEYPKNKQWEITAACFTLNGNRLDKYEFPNQHKTKNQVKLRKLEAFVSKL